MSLPASFYKQIDGYFDNGNFYYDNAKTKLINPQTGIVYYDIPNEANYKWDLSVNIYVKISYSTSLLPIRSNKDIIPQYKQINYDENGLPITTTIGSNVICEHNRVLYIGLTAYENGIRMLYFYKYNLMKTEYSFICKKPGGIIYYAYLGNMLCDGKYLYIITTASENAKIVRISLIPDPEMFDVQTFTVSSLSAYPYSYGLMQWQDEDDKRVIIIPTKEYFVFFDTVQCYGIDTITYGSAGGTLKSAVVGKTRGIVTTTGGRCMVYDFEQPKLTNRQLPIPTTSYACVTCYDKDHSTFYVAQSAYLTMYDETADFVADRFNPYVISSVGVTSIPVPWPTSWIVKTITYSNNLVLVTFEKQKRHYIYDTKHKTFHSFSLKWDLPTTTDKSGGVVRPCGYDGNFYLSYYELCCINNINSGKYRFGMVGTDYAFIYNDAEKDNYEYDDRFIEFTETSVTIHDGFIPKEVLPTDHDNVKKFAMKKSDYNKLKFIKFK